MKVYILSDLDVDGHTNLIEVFKEKDMNKIKKCIQDYYISHIYYSENEAVNIEPQFKAGDNIDVWDVGFRSFYIEEKELR